MTEVDDTTVRDHLGFDAQIGRDRDRAAARVRARDQREREALELAEAPTIPAYRGFGGEPGRLQFRLDSYSESEQRARLFRPRCCHCATTDDVGQAGAEWRCSLHLAQLVYPAAKGG